MTQEWRPELKQYPHFDAPISASRVNSLVRDPDRVGSNAFLPFITFDKTWQPFRGRVKDGVRPPKPDPKSRAIRYASHRDSQIFSYYRWLLASRYEKLLFKLGLEGAVLAYRRVATHSGGGKSNIHFAKDAFDAICGYDSCVVVCLDISKFFESLDHQKLRGVWERLWGSPLTPDHLAVFDHITRYADVSRDEAYVRLGFAQRVKKGTGTALKLTMPAKKLPKQLATPKDFRLKIAGGDGSKSLIEVNKKGFGVPQGAPLSDLLANAYLLCFDQVLKEYVDKNGGVYFRYSDDILIIVPNDDGSIAHDIEAFAISEMAKQGPQLKIKPSKTAAYRYWRDGDRLRYDHLCGKGKNGLEYLGFLFDGQYARIKDTTLSRLHRNIVYGARNQAHRHVSRYTGKSLTELVELFDFASFAKKFGRVPDFDPASDPKKWTFWTYARRSMNIMGTLGRPIEGQMQRQRAFMRRTVVAELARILRQKSDEANGSVSLT